MEVFHILELAGVPYEMEISACNERYEHGVEGSHLLVFLMGTGRTLKKPFLRSGLYRMEEEGGCAYRRAATDYTEIQSAEEFIVIDGPPGGDLGPVDDFHRLCRLLFGHPLEGAGPPTLTRALSAVEWVRRQIIAEESHA